MHTVRCLALDTDIASSTARPTLLDVVDNTFSETPDGSFDEYDIQQFLAKFDEYSNYVPAFLTPPPTIRDTT